MKAMILPRIFLHKVNGQDIRLTDPDTRFSVADVQNFYAGTYPVITNAKVTGPEIKDDELQFRFDSIMGTKG